MELDYTEYNSLNDYEKKTLPATNYWRVVNGKDVIPVPETDENYKKYFDKRCYNVYRDNLDWEKRKNEKKPIEPEPEPENNTNQISLF